MDILTILVVLLLILALAGAPGLGFHSMGWGPSGLFGLVLLIVLIYILLGRG